MRVVLIHGAVFVKFVATIHSALIFPYTLKRKWIISPSLTIYSLPSKRTLPASFAATILPLANKSSYETVSARIKPLSKSE